MARVWPDYLIAIGWGEWEEVRKGNISVAIVPAAVILAR